MFCIIKAFLKSLNIYSQAVTVCKSLNIKNKYKKKMILKLFFFPSITHTISSDV